MENKMNEETIAKLKAITSKIESATNAVEQQSAEGHVDEKLVNELILWVANLSSIVGSV